MGGMPRPDASAKLAATAPRRSRSGLAIIIAAVVFVAVVVAVVVAAVVVVSSEQPAKVKSTSMAPDTNSKFFK